MKYFITDNRTELNRVNQNHRGAQLVSVYVNRTGDKWLCLIPDDVLPKIESLIPAQADRNWINANLFDTYPEEFDKIMPESHTTGMWAGVRHLIEDD